MIYKYFLNENPRTESPAYAAALFTHLYMDNLNPLIFLNELGSFVGCLFSLFVIRERAQVADGEYNGIG